MTSPETVEADVTATTSAASSHSRTEVIWLLLRRPTTSVAVAFLVLLVIVAIAAPLLAPYDPRTQDLSIRLMGMSGKHWLGTDEYGRDVLSRIMYASRVALLAPLIAIGVAALLGIPAALFAAFRRGRIDAVLTLISDTLLSVPALVFALAMISVVGRGLTTAMIAIGVMLAPHLFRIVRGATMVVVEETYVSSAKAIGSGTGRTLRRHVLPNIAAPMLVQVTLLMAVSLLAEAGLSFLGLGVQPPESSWGSMLKAAYEHQFDSPWSVLPPGVAIVLTVLAFNTIGDALRDILAGRKSDD